MARSWRQLVAASLLLPSQCADASESPAVPKSIANITSNLRGSVESWPLERACVALGSQCDLEADADGPNGCCWDRGAGRESSCTPGPPLAVPIGTCMPRGDWLPLDHYTANALYNCFAGHGGVELGVVASTPSPAACAEACDRDAACVGFVYMYSQQKCWKRASIDLASCEVGEWATEGSMFSTFVKKDQPITTPAPTAPSSPDDYAAHPLYNCYSGHGGVKLGEVAVTQSTQACADLCGQNWACEGFVFMYSQNKCWLRAGINLQECEVGVQGQESGEFITFTRNHDVGPQCVAAGQPCGCPGCLTSSCCAGHQCLEANGAGGHKFCVSAP